MNNKALKSSVTIVFILFVTLLLAQRTTERDVLGNYVYPTVSIESVIDQRDFSKIIPEHRGKLQEYRQFLQNSCYTGLSYSKYVHFIDRSIDNPIYKNIKDNQSTPQFLLRITLHEANFMTSGEQSSNILDAHINFTLTLIDIETSAIIKQLPFVFYASDNEKQYNAFDESSLRSALFSLVVEGVKAKTACLLTQAREVKKILQEDDDWAEIVALDDKNLENIRKNQEMEIITVKKEYIRDDATYRWSKKIGTMKQGSFEKKDDIQYFEIIGTDTQKAVKKAMKNKERVFGIIQ